MASVTPRRRRKHRMADMNVVPYIDVMLVLLIIFMITSPLLVEGVNVDLPKTDFAGESIAVAEEGELLLVSMDVNKAVYFQNEEQPLSVEELITRLTEFTQPFREANQTAPVVYLKADKAVAYGDVMQLMGRLREADLFKVSLVVVPEIEKAAE